jgi:hypothetical protein
MSVTAKDIYGPIPPTTRGVPVHLGGDVKGDKILICVGSTVAIRSQKDLIKTELYQEHVHNTTVARLAPSGFYCASAGSFSFALALVRNLMHSVEYNFIHRVLRGEIIWHRGKFC